MNPNAWWLCIWLALWAMPAAAQRMPWRYVAQAEGLSNLVVQALAQDQAGYLWIGTDSGLARFDGQRAVRVRADGPSPRNVNALHVGSGNELWVGTPQGLFVRTTPEAPWRELRSAGGALPVEHGQALADAPEGGVLVVSEHRLWRIASPGAQAEPAFAAGESDPGKVASVLQGQEGLWLGCGEGLCAWRNGQLRRFGPAEGVPATVWKTLIEGPGGSLWARAAGLVLELPSGQQRFVDRSLAGADRRVLHVAQPLLADRDGGVLTYADEGLARWDGRRWHLIGPAQGLAVAGGVQALWLDSRSGSLWAGTAGRGLVQWRGYPHTRIWDKLPGDEAWTFFEDAERRMHVGTGSRLVTLGADGQPSITRGPERSQQIGAIAQDRRGRLWHGSFSGELWRRDRPDAPDHLVARLPLIFRLLLDRRGDLWVATQRGIYRIALDGPEAAPQLMPFDALQGQRGAPQTFWACEAADGALWFATAEGLLRHAEGRWTHVRPSRADAKGEQPMPANALACAADGTLWVGNGDQGRLWLLSRSDGPGGGWQAVEHTPAALADSQLYALLLDHRGGLWLSTAQGLLVRQGEQWRSVREQDGLVSDDCNQLALYEDQAGAIWAGSSRGATRWVPPSRWPEPVMPVLAQAEHGDQRLATGHALSLPWSTASLVLSFDLPDLRAGPDQRLHYRMEGLDDRAHVGTGRELRYVGLPPGRYQLSVWTEWADTGQASAPLLLSIEIVSPWWRTVWAAIGGAASLVLLLFAGYRWRLRRFRARQHELEALVQERTREVEASRNALHELAMKDALTGLWNRRALMERLKSEAERCARMNAPLSLVLCDADHFKRINDTHGHGAGDEVLCEIARRLLAGTRGYDCVGRYGGEEFLLIMPELNLLREADRLRLEAMRAAIADQPVEAGAAAPLRVTCSFGAITVAPGDKRALQAFIHEADQALYEAKAQGRNRVVVAPAG